MRFRTLGILVATLSVAGGILGTPSASAYQLMIPPATAAGPVAPSLLDAASAVIAPEPCPLPPSVVDSSLPELSAGLETGVSVYAKDPTSWDADTWMDSGGPAGGGVPASAVRALMRRGLAAGLTDELVRSFLQPGFLRGMGAPGAGAGLFEFIGEQNDASLLLGLASYAKTLAGQHLSQLSAQTDLFDAFPVLRVAYMSLARAVPPNLVTAEEMLALANQGYRPAQEAVQAFLARGNHPSAGAQYSGGVPDLMQPDVYDLFVAGYAGPLTPDAAAAVANRRAYLAWVARIADWVDSGAQIDQAPDPAPFVTWITSSTSAPVTAAAQGVPPATC